MTAYIALAAIFGVCQIATVLIVAKAYVMSQNDRALERAAFMASIERLQAEGLTLARRENWTPPIPGPSRPKPEGPAHGDSAAFANVGRVMQAPTKPATVHAGAPEEFPTS